MKICFKKRKKKQITPLIPCKYEVLGAFLECNLFFFIFFFNLLILYFVSKYFKNKYLTELHKNSFIYQSNKKCIFF